MVMFVLHRMVLHPCLLNSSAFLFEKAILPTTAPADAASPLPMILFSYNNYNNIEYKILTGFYHINNSSFEYFNVLQIDFQDSFFFSYELFIHHRYCNF